VTKSGIGSEFEADSLCSNPKYSVTRERFFTEIRELLSFASLRIVRRAHVHVVRYPGAVRNCDVFDLQTRIAVSS